MARLVAALWCLNLVALGTARAADSEELQVRTVVEEMNDALEHNDVGRLERIWADDYVFTAPSGTLLTKEQRLAAFRSGSFRFTRHSLEECEVRIYDQTALAIGRVTAEGSDRGRAFSAPARFTGVYVKRNGRWRCVAAQATNIATSAEGGRHAEEIRPGVFAGRDLGSLPLPVSGYQVYLMGEQHGIAQTPDLMAQYLAKLNAAIGLRDVALEEDAVYEHGAEDYVELRSNAIPEPLCLRAAFLQVLRRFNEGREPSARIRVHLVDIDTPASAILQHLLAIKGRVPGADSVRIPATSALKRHGLEAVAALERLRPSTQVLRELRTIRYSILAYLQGLEVGTRHFKGSPYLDEREEAIAENVRDLLRQADCPAVLALYGSDHVSKAARKDGGPRRDRGFAPLALRLEQSGLKVFSLMAYPLAGRTSWRGSETEIPYSADEGNLASGESLEHVLAAAPEATLLYVDPSRQRVKLPTQDASRAAVDAFLLLASATAMDDRCVANVAP